MIAVTLNRRMAMWYAAWWDMKGMPLKPRLNVWGGLYDLVRLYINFFQPTMKLVSKSRHGARVHKVYDTARTPYQRLVQSGVLTGSKQAELAAIYQGLNPVVLLLNQINDNLEKLWRLTEHPSSVTRIMRQ
jgi:hypothetical protein